LRFLKEQIESSGHEAVLMDISMGADTACQADITPQEIAGLAGKDIEVIRVSKDRLSITNVMSSGGQQKALDILSKGELDGIVSLGGSTRSMRYGP
jgi:uncharacterized protein (UPF0261 family)